MIAQKRARHRHIYSHVMEHKELYIGIGFSIAVITMVIMRDNLSQPIRRGIPVPARRGIPVPGENVAMNNISHSFFRKGFRAE